MTGAQLAHGAKHRVTSQVERAAGDVKDAAYDATHNVWVERAARLGYAVRGALYFLVGALALLVAAGKGGAVTTTSGAITTVATLPGGRVLLAVVVVGLVGYSLWGFVRALLDPLRRGSDAKGLMKRAGYLISGLAYGSLAIAAGRLLMGAWRSGGAAATGAAAQGSGNASLAGHVLSLPAGQWLLAALGVAWILGAGVGQLVQAYRASFRRDFESWDMSPEQLRWATVVGRAGLAARGVVFCLVGYFLVMAALHTDASQAKGLDGALQTLAAQPYGPVLLGLVAAGLACFGVYSACCAFWVRVPLNR